MNRDNNPNTRENYTTNRESHVTNREKHTAKCFATAALLLLAGLGIGYYASRYSVTTSTTKWGSGIINEKQCMLRRTMEKLWAEHAVWDRQFTVSTIAELKDVDATKQRLLKNQDDIGNAMIPFYGKEAGDQVTRLLKEHINIGGDIVKAAMVKDDARKKELEKQWHTNADELAQFLSQANPNWSKKDLTKMFYKHLELLTENLHARLKGDWKEEIAKADEALEQSRMMGKDLADGIIKQYQDKF